MPSIKVLPSFRASLRLLSEGRRKHMAARIRRFQANPEEKVLRFRPLRCAPGHFLIDSVRGDRIILRRDGDDLFSAVDCGGHEIIDTWERTAAAPPVDDAATKH